MALYYSINFQSAATSGSTQTEVDHLRLITGTTRGLNLVQVIASARGNVVGGGSIRIRRFQTPATVGATVTVQPKDPGAQATTVTASTNPTTGTGTNFNVMSIGFSQTGAQGFWGAAEPNDGVLLNAGGGQNGNVDAISIAIGTTITFDLTTDHIE